MRALWAAAPISFLWIAGGAGRARGSTSQRIALRPASYRKSRRALRLVASFGGGLAASRLLRPAASWPATQ